MNLYGLGEHPLILKNIKKIDFKEWNKTLTELNGGNRARYYEFKKSQTTPFKYADLEILETADYEYIDALKKNKEDPNLVFYYTVSVKEKKLYLDRDSGRIMSFKGCNTREKDGYEITIRLATNNRFNPEDCYDYTNNSDGVDQPMNLIAEMLVYGINKIKNQGDYSPTYINNFHDWVKKLTTLTKEAAKEKVKKEPKRDSYGVEIEVGDWVACGAKGSYGYIHADVFQVEKINPTAVHGHKPEMLVVVKTNNKDKKLGWG